MRIRSSDFLSARGPNRFILSRSFKACATSSDFASRALEDISIGYLNHTEAAVRLYLQETFTLPLLTTEAAVVLVPPGK